MVAHHTLPMMKRQLDEANAIIAAQNEKLAGIASKKKPGEFAGSPAPSASAEPKSLDELTKKMFGDNPTQ
jgi:hypothetical protein